MKIFRIQATKQLAKARKKFIDYSQRYDTQHQLNHYGMCPFGPYYNLIWETPSDYDTWIHSLPRYATDNTRGWPVVFKETNLMERSGVQSIADLYDWFNLSSLFFLSEKKFELCQLDVEDSFVRVHKPSRQVIFDVRGIRDFTIKSLP